MPDALPKAVFLGFPVAPLMTSGEVNAKDVFGHYVSEYDFRQSVADGATVPLFSGNRIPELLLANERLRDGIYRVVADAELAASCQFVLPLSLPNGLGGLQPRVDRRTVT